MSKDFFHYRRHFSHKILPRLVEKYKEFYVFLALEKYHYANTSFDIWMSKGACDVFALVINFLGSDWQPKHVTISLFEAIETI
jgi:hypothetical protein